SIIHNSIFYKHYDEIKPSESKNVYVSKISSAVDLLSMNQADNGGFGWFDYDAVDYELSAYVGVALGLAADSGAIELDSRIDNLKQYLHSRLDSEEISIDERIYAVYSLAVLRESEILPYAIWLKNNSNEFGDSPLSVAHLMLALQRLGNMGDAGELIPLLELTAVTSARAAIWEDRIADFNVVKSAEYTTATAYLALSKYDGIELAELARNWLIDNPVSVTGNSFDAVSIFYALTAANINNVEGRKGSNTVSVIVNGKDVKTFTVGGDDDWIGKVDLSINPGELKYGVNKIEINRSGDGELYVVANLSYYSDMPEDNPEFEVKRFIRDFYSGTPVSSAVKGQVVIVRSEVRVDRDAYNLVVHDFVPAGFEPVQYELGGYSYDFASKWWQWGNDDYVNRYGTVAQDHVTFTEYKVRSGDVYSFEFPAVAVYEGDFSGAGAQAFLLNFDDIGGFAETGVVRIED
ncbi:MAG: hypothetical protein U9Q67_00865, partial [Patescibacteria group bacterium]|nr:hypothetical protein [Patescibacteria group bacterium]